MARIIFLTGFIILAAVASTTALNYRGVCLLGPAPTDEERISRVVDAFLENQSFTEETAIEEEVAGVKRQSRLFTVRDKELLRYRDEAEFRAENPHCCDITPVGKKGAPGSLLSMLNSSVNQIASTYAIPVGQTTQTEMLLVAWTPMSSLWAQAARARRTWLSGSALPPARRVTRSASPRPPVSSTN